jgi:hypothetical protein
LGDGIRKKGGISMTIGHTFDLNINLPPVSGQQEVDTGTITIRDFPPQVRIVREFWKKAHPESLFKERIAPDRHNPDPDTQSRLRLFKTPGRLSLFFSVRLMMKKIHRRTRFREAREKAARITTMGPDLFSGGKPAQNRISLFPAKKDGRRQWRTVLQPLPTPA